MKIFTECIIKKQNGWSMKSTTFMTLRTESGVGQHGYAPSGKGTVFK